MPLAGDDGRTVYVNRGFLPEGSRVEAARRSMPAGPVRIEGLLRLSEPKGRWLRTNRPGEDRWYTRDIAAIAAKRRVPTDPRLFIDSWVETPGAPPGPDAPVAGLTVIAFPNNHLGYALTWFTMGIMAIGGAFVLVRRR